MENFEFNLTEAEELEAVESLWYVAVGSHWVFVCP